MLADARRIDRDTVVETDVCVVGAGAAGITLAREFIGSPYRVTLLESGGFGYELDTQDLYQGPNRGLPYFPLDGVRLRYFGGTTNHWGGFCRPFEAVDFEPREGIPHTGWPIELADLHPFYGPASTICGLPSEDWRAADSASSNAPVRLRRDRFVNRTVRIVAPERRSFAPRFRSELVKAPNVTVQLHANVTGVETDESGRSATSLRVATLSGNRFTVRAKIFVMAAGGLENPRLLLASNQQWPAGLGNHTGVVGRFFMEHPRFVAGFLAPTGTQPNPRFYSEHQAGRERLQGYLGSAREFQLSEGLLDVQITMEQVYEVPRDVSEYAGYVSDVVTDLGSWERIAIPGSPVPVPYPEVIRRAQSDPKDTYNALRRKVDTMRVTTRIEQAPNPDSRVTLIRERDDLGMHRIALNWKLSEIDKRNVNRTLALFGAEVGRAGIGRLKILHGADETGWPADTAGGWHLMGTTRMSNDPKRGVVDRDCRVHGVSNLYIAGSSVFPTAGGATPTLTLVALTLRLAQHLKGTVLR